MPYNHTHETTDDSSARLMMAAGGLFGAIAMTYLERNLGLSHPNTTAEHISRALLRTAGAAMGAVWTFQGMNFMNPGSANFNDMMRGIGASATFANMIPYAARVVATRNGNVRVPE